MSQGRRSPSYCSCNFRTTLHATRNRRIPRLDTLAAGRRIINNPREQDRDAMERGRGMGVVVKPTQI